MKKIFISFIALSLISVSCNKTDIITVDDDSSAQMAALDVSPSIIKNQVIVELTEELTQTVEKDVLEGNFLQTKSGEVNTVFSNIGAVSVTPLFDNGGEFEERHREAGLHRWFRITYDTSVPTTKAMSSLDEIEGVLSVEPVRKVKSTAIFNDPGLSKQWHYINNGSLGQGFSAGCDINVLPVWKNYTAGSNKVIVAIQDGGIDMEHEDLAAVTIPGGPNGSKNFVTNTFNIVPHRHGTHVAGTVGAINNNDKGVSGIAGGKDGNGGVKLLSCQVFVTGDDGKDKGGDMYNAMVWGADHGAVISQNSWGTVYDTKEDAANGRIGGMKAAIDYFIKYAGCDKKTGEQLPDSPMKGGVVIFSAGNEGWPNGWPAQYSAEAKCMISVGSIGPGYTRAFYSNYGDWVSICAPGGDSKVGNTVYSTLPGNQYGYMQGTSMACPHVSGVAALIVSYCGGQGFTNEMLVDKLIGGANASAVSSYAQIGPLVDAFGAITYGETIAPDAVKSYTVTASSNNLDFTWNVTEDEDDGKAYGYLLLASKNKSDIDKLDTHVIPSSVKCTSVLVGDLSVGDEISGQLSDLEFDQVYYSTIVAYDYVNNRSSAAPVKSVSSGHNNPPTVTTDYNGSFKVKSHETLKVEYAISDPDGHRVTVSFSAGSEAATSELLPDGNYRLTIVGKNSEPGDYTATYHVVDSYGAVTDFVIPYTLLENHAPEIKKDIESMLFEDMSMKKSINMDDYLYDPDGEQLTYSVSMTQKGIVHLNQVGNVLNMTTLDFGRVSIVITATDARGLNVKLEFSVLVRDADDDADVYPTQVKDYLNISDGAEKTVKVSLSNSAGQVVYTVESECSAFNPLRIDMTDFAPGIYGVHIDASGKITDKKIVKL